MIVMCVYIITKYIMIKRLHTCNVDTCINHVLVTLVVSYQHATFF